MNADLLPLAFDRGRPARPHPAAVPPGALDLGGLAEPAVVLPGTVTGAELDEVLRADELLTSVVLDAASGPLLVPRASFAFYMAGRLGYGRALWTRRPVTEMEPWTALVLPAGTGLGDAAQAVLARVEERRYDDVVVRWADGRLGIAPTSRIFEQLASFFAHHSLHDPLTGLPNRLFLAARAGELAGGHGALLYIDLDGFKAVNDEHGHLVGDQVLIDFATRLAEVVRPQDVIARLGGDEFAVLLTDPVSPAVAEAVAERIVLSAAAPFIVGDLVVSVGASIGLTQLPAGEVERRADTVEVLLRQADAAMYRAKTAGRGRVQHYTAALGQQRAKSVRDSLASRLQQALDAGQLELHYQPIYDLASGELSRLEALARWRDPVRGYIGPGEFIPAAEATGLIGRLGAWALQEACGQAARWTARDGLARAVAVNVSARQLMDRTVLQDVQAALAASGLPPGQLCLEITESAVIEDLAATVEQLVALRHLGVRLALDDFGTGYSSLTLIRQLPVDIVKIDRSFVDRVDTDPADAILVRLVTEAAHSLGMRVCAEGVERDGQLRHLTALGCDSVQGFLLGIPAPAAGVDLNRPLVPQDASGTGPDPAAALLLPQSSELVVIADDELVLRYVSAASIGLLGYTPGELVGSAVAGLLHPDELPGLTRRWAQRHQVRAGEPPFTIRVRHADGSYRWLRVTTRMVEARSGGGSRQLLCSAYDVTAGMQVRQELARTQHLFRTAFDLAPGGMALVRPDGVYVEVNRAWGGLLGYPSSELVGQHFSVLTHPSDLAPDEELLAGLLAGEHGHYRMRKRFRHADGSWLWAELTVGLIRDEAGRPQHLISQIAPVPG